MLVGSKRKFNIDGADYLQPIAKRSKIIYTENPNDSKGALIPHIGIYSDHQLVCKLIIYLINHLLLFIDKLKLEQKQASVPKKTELHEMPTLLKLMSQPGSNRTGDATQEPTNTK